MVAPPPLCFGCFGPRLCSRRAYRECGDDKGVSHVILFLATCCHLVLWYYPPVDALFPSHTISTWACVFCHSITMPPSRRTEAGYLRTPSRYAARSPSPQPAALNLRRYLRGTILPSIARNDRSHPYCLPDRGRRSHKNKLRVRKDPDRHIDQIRRHEPKAFDHATKQCQLNLSPLVFACSEPRPFRS